MKEPFHRLLGQATQEKRESNLDKININQSQLEGLYLDDSHIDLSTALQSSSVDSVDYIQDSIHPPLDNPASSVNSPPVLVRSEASLLFLKFQLQQPLGKKMVAAGLLSPDQLQILLEDQKQQSDLLLGEIVLLRNWVKEQTLEFFVNLETAVSPEFCSLPIGQRLQKAGLVKPDQLEQALRDQKQLRGKLGQVLILNRVIRQATANYFARL